MAKQKIAIIGAGRVGGNLGERLCKAGYEVRFGAREPGKLSQLTDKCGKNASAASVEDASKWADVVFFAVPGTAVIDAVRSAGKLDGKVVVDCNNPVEVVDKQPVLMHIVDGSLTAAIARVVPAAKVVKAFNVFGAEFHLDPALAGGARVDVYIAGDDADAKRTVSEIAETAGFAPMDAGPLRNAAVLENVALLWIHFAFSGLGRDKAFKLTGRG